MVDGRTEVIDSISEALGERKWAHDLRHGAVQELRSRGVDKQRITPSIENSVLLQGALKQARQSQRRDFGVNADGPVRPMDLIAVMKTGGSTVQAVMESTRFGDESRLGLWNLALWSTGMWLQVPQGHHSALPDISASSSRPISEVWERWVIQLDPQSQLEITSGCISPRLEPSVFQSRGFQIDVGDGARMKQLLLTPPGQRGSRQSTTSVDVHHAGSFHQSVASLGTEDLDLDLQVRLHRAKARAEVRSASFTSDSGRSHQRISIAHNVADTHSSVCGRDAGLGDAVSRFSVQINRCEGVQPHSVQEDVQRAHIAGQPAIGDDRVFTELTLKTHSGVVQTTPLVDFLAPGMASLPGDVHSEMRGLIDLLVNESVG
jgi:Fe-S cluster assembly scaffold protein SufB